MQQYVTYSDLVAFAVFIVAFVTLVFTILMYVHKKTAQSHWAVFSEYNHLGLTVYQVAPCIYIIA